MDMYYRVWCPICEKPEVKTSPTLNFLQVVKHLEAKYPDRLVTWEQSWASRNDPEPLVSHKDALWDLLCDRIRNDVYVSLGFKSWYEEQDDPDENGRIIHGTHDYTEAFELMGLIVKEFENEVEGDFDHVLWEVSW